MGWWIAALVTWLISFSWIVYMMVDVVRHKTGFVKAMPGYLFHGVTAVLALWFVLKALGS